MSSIIYEIKKSYKAPIAILAFVGIITLGLKSRAGIFEQSAIFDILIFLLPLSASIASFAVSNRYGDSKVFGRSYFLLGCGFFATFLGELLYSVYDDVLDESILDNFDYLFVAGCLFTIFHIVINVRYFAEKLESYQKALVVLIPVFIVSMYSFLVFANSHEPDYYFYFNLLFVALSAVILGLVIAGFTLFRHTVLISAWFLLLIGFFVGTIGDLEFRYYHTFGGDYLGNNSTVLWIASNIILVYALYRHQKAI